MKRSKRTRYSWYGQKVNMHFLFDEWNNHKFSGLLDWKEQSFYELGDIINDAPFAKLLFFSDKQPKSRQTL